MDEPTRKPLLTPLESASGAGFQGRKEQRPPKPRLGGGRLGGRHRGYQTIYAWWAAAGHLRDLCGHAPHRIWGPNGFGPQAFCSRILRAWFVAPL
jgi:hypothetical protein